MLLTASLVMAAFGFHQSRQLTKEEVQQKAIETIGALLAEFGDRLSLKPGRLPAACYVRYSTDRQDSFEAQLRAIFSYAAANGLTICRESIFYDLGISGAKHDRQGLSAIRQARKYGEFEVFLAFTTSRLARNLKTLLEVLDEEFVGNGTRCVLVDQNLDSKEKERWKLLLPLMGWLDEIQRTNQAGYVRAAHRNLLARRLFYSTATYGIGGEVIQGFFTKRGRPIRMMVIDAEMAKVLKYIFRKTINKVPPTWIPQRLNQNRNWPRPPKSKKNRFSRDFVDRALQNTAYLGVFVYNDEVDLSLHSPDEMRELAKTDPNVFHFPDLQIISDEDFLKARQVLEENRLSQKSKPKKPRVNKSDDSQPMLLNGLLRCPGCDNRLVVMGARGNAYACKSCKNFAPDQRFLYSHVNRKIATEKIANAICDQVLSVPGVIERCVSASMENIEMLGKPDETTLKELAKTRKQVKDQLDLVIENFQGENRSLVEDNLENLKSELRSLDTNLSLEQKKVNKVLKLPSRDELCETLTGLDRILVDASNPQVDPEQLDEARTLMHLLIGGSISMYQQGEKKAKRGWLQARFQVDLGALALNGCGLKSDPSQIVDMVVDCVADVEVNPKIVQAREMYDADMFETEIAEALEVSRGCVFKWLEKSFAAEGKSKPDGYERRKRIERERGLHLYQRISDQVFELAEQGLHLGEIADQLKVDRNTVTDSLRYAREKRGLPLLDGRTRRRDL